MTLTYVKHACSDIDVGDFVVLCDCGQYRSHERMHGERREDRPVLTYYDATSGPPERGTGTGDG